MRIAFFSCVLLALAACRQQTPIEAPASLQSSEARGDIEVPANEPDHGEQSVPASNVDGGVESPQSPQGVKSNSDANSDDPVDTIPLGNWTTLRLIVLADGGPNMIDLMARLGDQDLDSASQSAVQSIADWLLGDVGPNATWQDLLDHQLIQSGWLGEAAPPAEQRRHVLSLYDKNRDEIAQPDELVLFLSRGFSGIDLFVFRDALDDTPRNSTGSYWGILDRNSDNLLDADEIASLPSLLGRIDFDGDSNLTLAEMDSSASQEMQIQPTRADSMLLQESVVAQLVGGLTLDEGKSERQRRQKVSQILQHYNFDNWVDREQWSRWSDEDWSKVDRDGDGSLKLNEALALFSVEPHTKIALRLPDQNQTKGPTATHEGDAIPAKWYFASRLPEVENKWTLAGSVAHFNTHGFALRLSVDDVYSRIDRQMAKAQLDSALRNEQLRGLITQQLGLAVDAFELADQDGDQRLSDQEFDRVWSWLTGRQNARLLAQWTIEDRPWFNLLDQDLNRRLGEMEISQAPSELALLDQNGDARLSSEELPMVASLQLRQNDQPLANLAAGVNSTSVTGQSGQDWFSAMDTNSDGAISRNEYLGSRQQFADHDLDRDGFVSRKEAFSTSAPLAAPGG